LGAEGVTVICVSRSESSCGQAADAINAAGGKAIARAVDVSDGPAVAKLCEALLAEYENIDILVNNAGITKDNLLFRMSEEDWSDVIETNLSSVFHFVKGLARPMTRKRWGRVINITSVSGIMGNAGQTNYAAAKAGMIGFTKSLAKELSKRSVTVNAVAPGFIETDMTAKLSAAAMDMILPMIPLNRMGVAADIANMVAYLASEEANYITGQTFTVDGGMAM
jgi:3-oxoacyl-[acyl-carrier protein] reductase